MKHTITFLFLILISLRINASGTYTVGVGAGNNYPNLYSAFDDVNNGVITGTLVFQVTSNLIETDPILIDSSGFGPVSYSSILIYPTNPNTTVIGNFGTSSLFDFKGADNITIDGRINATGSTMNLRFENVGANNIDIHSVFLFQNNAQYNKVVYCDVSANGTTAYPIRFSTGQNGNGSLASTLLGGNSFNRISYCKFHAGAISKIQSAIYASGTGTSYNHTDTLSYNEFYDIANVSSNAVNLLDRTAGWYISENSFYEPTAQTTSIYYRAINISETSNNLPGHVIDNNYIGGSMPQCSGSPFSLLGGVSNKTFIGIRMVSSTPYVYVKNNIIKNIEIDNNASQSEYAIIGIEHNTGKCKIENNTIGSDVGNHSIKNTNASGQASNTSNGICGVAGIWLNGADSIYITGNKIGSISTYQPSNLHKSSIVGINNINVDSRLIIADNLIGSNSTSNSLQANSPTLALQNVIGIYCTEGLIVGIQNNMISHLFNGWVGVGGTGSLCTGLLLTGNSGYEVNGNTIKNITCNSAFVGNAVSGMKISGLGTRTITNNKISSIQNLNPTASAFEVYGLQITPTGNGSISILNNFIHTILAGSSSAIVYGIHLNGNTIQAANNIVGLNNSGCKLVGIYNNALSSVIQHNTIYLGGSPMDFPSICLENIKMPPTVRCNIFVNANKNTVGNLKQHHCMVNTLDIVWTGTVNGVNTYNTTMNGNNYRAPFTTLGGAVGKVLTSGSNYNTFAHWVTLTAQEANGISVDPQFTLAGGTSASNYFPNAVLTTIPVGITSDYFGTLRSLSLPFPGALESQEPLPLTMKSFDVKRYDNVNHLTWITSSEQNTSHFEIEKSNDSRNWKTIASQIAAGNSETEKTYQAKDDETIFGMNYYRIKSVDMDGKFSYSTVEKIYIENLNDVTIYPNPVMTTLNISLNNAVENTLIEIYSLEGRILLSEKTNNLNHTINIETLAKGTYMIRISNTEKTYTSKFVRQ